MVYPPSARNTTNLDPETKNAEQLSFFLRNNNKIGVSHIIAKSRSVVLCYVSKPSR